MHRNKAAAVGVVSPADIERVESCLPSGESVLFIAWVAKLRKRHLADQPHGLKLDASPRESPQGANSIFNDEAAPSPVESVRVCELVCGFWTCRTQTVGYSIACV